MKKITKIDLESMRVEMKALDKIQESEIVGGA